MSARLATWNINSVRLRIGLVLQFLKEHGPDVLCLQEIKCLNEQFPAKELAEAGYVHQAVHGQKGYHGVAIVSRLPLADTNSRTFCDIPDSRHVSVRVDLGTGPVTLHNFYIPAGGDEPDPEVNPKFRHKLDFLAELKTWFDTAEFEKGQVIVGDFNIAPHENDVWSHKQLLKVVSHTPIETETLNDLLARRPWVDLVRKHIPSTKSSIPGGLIAQRTGTPPTRDAGSTISGRPAMSPRSRSKPRSSGPGAAWAKNPPIMCR